MLKVQLADIEPHTDHVPLEAMNIELSRQESVSRL